MIISKRHLGTYKPDDEIPAGYFDDAALKKHIAWGRVVIVDELQEKTTNYDDMGVAELRNLIDELGIEADKRSKQAMIEALENGN